VMTYACRDPHSPQFEIGVFLDLVPVDSARDGRGLDLLEAFWRSVFAAGVSRDCQRRGGNESEGERREAGGLTALRGQGPCEAARLRRVQGTLNSRGRNRNPNWTSPSPSLRRTWTTARQSSRRRTAPATGAVLPLLRACPWLWRIWPWYCKALAGCSSAGER
jgi:hypothetical protein